MSQQIFTIGHSTHPLDRFLGLLAQQHIETVVDIRRFPGSRKFPHFNQTPDPFHGLVTRPAGLGK